jgi:hypothetical protein
MATKRAKPTAAAPSFNRLSASTSMLKRRSTFISRKEAMTETGSVAAIRTPNSAALIQLQPIRKCMPPATAIAAITTPRNANPAVRGKSRRKAFHSKCSAASKTRGGRKMLKIRSRVSGNSIAFGSSASVMPAITSPTLYGSLRRRETMATRDAVSRTRPREKIENSGKAVSVVLTLLPKKAPIAISRSP